MALLEELGPVFVFALTAGVSAFVTLGARRSHRDGTRPFGSALRVGLLGAGLLYLAATLARSLATGGSAEDVPGLLFVALVAFLVLAVLPLAVGRRLLRRATGVDSDTALRFAADGWAVTMLAVFGLYLAYWLLAQGLYYPGHGRICYIDQCTGVTVASAVTILAGSLVAVLGPGLAGLRLRAAAEE
ncbi:hypothetical protein [Halopelagius longus]|uniref:Uncharacterized protein n=1 Tax=Halopelagius longus TaxID=1236180 RepID=A0A1H1EYK7_9EURY|nr:hypothetical protein [Halopelagius longus]RDI71925.1 hypothetical protein DWB78_09430 [Halopelagius longus]SDQ93216.1 hypothetical protein SAMN05216278_3104 [Halopelagius longus]